MSAASPCSRSCAQPAARSVTARRGASFPASLALFWSSEQWAKSLKGPAPVYTDVPTVTAAGVTPGDGPAFTSVVTWTAGGTRMVRFTADSASADLVGDVEIGGGFYAYSGGLKFKDGVSVSAYPTSWAADDVVTAVAQVTGEVMRVLTAESQSLNVAAHTRNIGTALLQSPTSSAAHKAVGIYGAGADAPSVSYGLVDGIQCMTVTANKGTAARPGLQFDVLSFSKQIPKGRVHALVKIHDPVNFLGITLLAGYASFANFYTGYYGGAVNNTNGWVIVAIEPPAIGDYADLSADTTQRKWVVGAGSPSFDSGTFTDVRFRLEGATGASSVTVSIAGIYVDEYATNPAIVVTADDGYASFYNSAVPVLEENGLRFTAGIIESTVGSSASYMTLTQLQDIVSRGHECVVHGDPPTGSLSGYSLESEIRADIAVDRDYLVTNGLAKNGSETVYIYPQGVYRHTVGDTRILNALKAEGFIGARSTDFGCSAVVDDKLKLNPYCLNIIGHAYSATNETANINRIILRMRQAVNNGRSVVLTFHKIVATPSNSDEISPENFALVCAEAKSLIDTGKARNMLLSEFVHSIYGAFSSFTTMPPLALAATAPGKLLEVQEWTKPVGKKDIDKVSP